MGTKNLPQNILLFQKKVLPLHPNSKAQHKAKLIMHYEL